MTCRAYVQLPLDIYGIDNITDTLMLKILHILLDHLEALYNRLNLDIFTLKKYRGDVFSEFFT